MSSTMAEPIQSETVGNSAARQGPPKKRLNVLLLSIYILCTAVGTIGSPLLQRLYYSKGGNLKWLQTWTQSIGFVTTVPFIAVLFLKNSSVKTTSSYLFFMDLKLLILSCFVGLIVGLNNYIYTTGLSYLPLSTSSLLLATQLAFTAMFAFLIVKQKFTFYSLNSILLMTLGAVVLCLHTSGDRPPGVSKGKYLLGFFLTLGGAALWGLNSPLVEFAYGKSKRRITFPLVLQVQVVMNGCAALFSTVGMLASHEFQAIREEASLFEMGEWKYYVILASTTLMCQLSTIGVMGVISCTNSLFNGILSSVLLPLTEIAAVIAFKEKFTGEKGLSLALCLWGFTSYFLGEYKMSQKPKLTDDHINGDQDPRTTDLELTRQAANAV